jgi:crossover junction endodeoxyribonuclease RusA
MTDRITFRVHGDPAPQGSKRLMGNGAMVESAGERLKFWRNDVRSAAFDALNRTDFHPLGSVEVSIVFSLRRPKSHFGTGRNSDTLKANAPLMHVQKPDVDKLLRGTLDALTSAGAYADDACVVHVQTSKTWCDVGEPPGAYISVVDIEREQQIPRMSRAARQTTTQGAAS